MGLVMMVMLLYNDVVYDVALAEIVSRKKMGTSWMYYVHFVDCKCIT